MSGANTTFRQNFKKVNELLDAPSTTSIGAYAMGVLTSLAEQHGVVAPDSLLEAAACCKSMTEAVQLYRDCAEFGSVKRKKR